jgi:streptogramin lyase
VHEAVQDISKGLGCEKVETYCQHAAIIIMLGRGGEAWGAESGTDRLVVVRG